MSVLLAQTAWVNFPTLNDGVQENLYDDVALMRGLQRSTNRQAQVFICSISWRSAPPDAENAQRV